MEVPHFDEKSGIIFASTTWGRWYQTIAEVIIEVDVENGTRGKDVKIDIKPSRISCVVHNKEIFKVFAPKITNRPEFAIKMFLRICIDQLFIFINRANLLMLSLRMKARGPLKIGNLSEFN